MPVELLNNIGVIHFERGELEVGIPLWVYPSMIYLDFEPHFLWDKVEPFAPCSGFFMADMTIINLMLFCC